MHLHTAMHRVAESRGEVEEKRDGIGGGKRSGVEAIARAEAIPKALLPRDSPRCDFSRGK